MHSISLADLTETLTEKAPVALADRLHLDHGVVLLVVDRAHHVGAILRVSHAGAVGAFSRRDFGRSQHCFSSPFGATNTACGQPWSSRFKFS